MIFLKKGEHGVLKILKLTLAALLFLLPGLPAVHAQSAPKYSNAFLEIGAGARGLAMAGTQAALSEGAEAVYWNPAGLSQMQGQYDFALMHAAYFAGIANYDFGAFAAKIDSNSFLGASVIRLGIDDIADTRFLIDADGRIDYDRVTSFSVADYAFLLSYARTLKNNRNISWGGTAKVIYRNYGLFSTAWGFGIDAGAQAKTKIVDLGLSLRDVTGTFNAWSHNPAMVQEVFIETGNAVPDNSMEVTLPKAFLDVSKTFSIKDVVGAKAVLGAMFAFDGPRNTLANFGRVSVSPSAGLELDVKKSVFLRGGVGGFQRVKSFDGNLENTYRLSFGLGFKVKRFVVDYALTDIGGLSNALYSNVFSLRFFLDEGFSLKKAAEKPMPANQ